MFNFWPLLTDYEIGRELQDIEKLEKSNQLLWVGYFSNKGAGALEYLGNPSVIYFLIYCCLTLIPEKLFMSKHDIISNQTYSEPNSWHENWRYLLLLCWVSKITSE